VLLLTISQQKALPLQSFFEFINLLIEYMTKAEIVAEISAKTGLEKQVVLTVVESMMDTIKTSMINGEEVFLRGFGSFIIKHRAEKTARNISKNTTIIIPEHNIPAFKPSKEFMEKVK
jgi:DNA-binding protein HU-beta